MFFVFSGSTRIDNRCAGARNIRGQILRFSTLKGQCPEILATSASEGGSGIPSGALVNEPAPPASCFSTGSGTCSSCAVPSKSCPLEVSRCHLQKQSVNDLGQLAGKEWRNGVADLFVLFRPRSGKIVIIWKGL
jgi:hypothetical protein